MAQKTKKINIFDRSPNEQERESYIKHIGDEWAKPSDVEKIVEEYIYPFITKKSVVAEIGVGGARKRINMRNRGIFTISIDLELAWGYCEEPIQPSIRHAVQLERDIIKRVLNLFSEYDIRATWAIVGHLLMAQCNWAGNKVHPEISRPVINDSRRDWFFQHPKNQEDPLWYGRDIIEWVKNVSPGQEIGSHSFCHLPYDEEITNYNAVKADIEIAKKLHEAFDLPFETFVFPGNIVGYKDLLAKAGIHAYRGKSRRWYDSIPCSLLGRLFNLVCFFMAIPPQTVTATLDETGMANIPDSMFILDQVGIRSLVSSRSLIKMGIAGLNRAVKRGEVFHLWFHPFSFTYKSDKRFYVLEAILKHARRLAENGQLEILTMGDIRKKSIETGKLAPEKTEIRKIRDRAIAQHNETTDYFEGEYQRMKEDYFQSVFTYGRKKLEVLLDEILQHLPEGSSILDVGCGTGEQLRRYRQLGFNVAGIEPSAKMRIIAQKRNPGVSIQDGIITSLPFQDESFDFVLAIEVLRYLHHADIRKAYREMLRVLKPGGRIFFTMVNRYALNGFYIYDTLRRFFFRLIHYKEPIHCEFVRPNEIRRDLNNLGVDDIIFHGRVFAPIEIAYKINARLGARITRFLEPLIDPLSQKKWMVPFTGHLIAITRKIKKFL